MYRIMLMKSKKDNYSSLYQFMTTTTEGVTKPLELEDNAALDAKVEDMLNNGGYAKSDFIIVQVVDYDVEASNYSDQE